MVDFNATERKWMKPIIRRTQMWNILNRTPLFGSKARFRARFRIELQLYYREQKDRWYRFPVYLHNIVSAEMQPQNFSCLNQCFSTLSKKKPCATHHWRADSVIPCLKELWSKIPNNRTGIKLGETLQDYSIWRPPISKKLTAMSINAPSWSIT